MERMDRADIVDQVLAYRPFTPRPAPTGGPAGKYRRTLTPPDNRFAHIVRAAQSLKAPRAV